MITKVYFLINLYKSVSVRGPFASIEDAEKEFAKISELNDDGWIIVRTL